MRFGENAISTSSRSTIDTRGDRIVGFRVRRESPILCALVMQDKDEE